MATRLVEHGGCSRHISRSVCDLTINCASTRSCTDTSSDVSATEGCSPELNFYCAFLCWKFIVEYILSYIPTSYDYCPRPDRGQEGFFAGCFLFWCNITFCYSRTHNYSTLIKRLWRAMLSRASKGLLALPIFRWLEGQSTHYLTYHTTMALWNHTYQLRLWSCIIPSTMLPTWTI